MKRFLIIALALSGTSLAASSDHTVSLKNKLTNLQIQKESLEADMQGLRDKFAELNPPEYTQRRPTDCEQRVYDQLYGHLESPSEKTKRVHRLKFAECRHNLELVELSIKKLEIQLRNTHS